MASFDFDAVRRRVAALAAERDAAAARREEAARRGDAWRAAFAAATEAQGLVQVAAETVQEHTHRAVAGVVSRCLAAVFDEPYEFRIVFERLRGRTEARLVFVRNGEEFSPLDSSGGGVVDVAAFALRVSCLMLMRPAPRRVVVLDEPFKFVSRDRRPALRSMLEGLCEELGMQIIMVTHIEELCCGTILEIGNGGVSTDD